MKNKLLVSIIIPTYNRKRVIERAIDSCLNQTYKNIEILVCDDHSTDGTIEYLKEIYFNNKSIRFFKTEEGKKGANVARNVGIKNAKGRIIAFLDSDDYLLEDSIECRLRVLLKTKCGLVYGNVYNQEERSRKLNLCKYDDINQYNQKKYLVQNLSLCITASIMVRKEALEKIDYLYEELKSWQDDDLVVDVGLRYKIEYLNYPVAVIVKSQDSMFRNKEIIYQGCKSIVEKHKKDIIIYSSYTRYVLWKIRVFYSWMNYKKQKGKLYIGETIFTNICIGIEKILKLFFPHM